MHSNLEPIDKPGNSKQKAEGQKRITTKKCIACYRMSKQDDGTGR